MFYDENLSQIDDEHINHLLSRCKKFTVHHNPYSGIIFDVRGLLPGVNSVEASFNIDGDDIVCEILINQIFIWIEAYKFFELSDKTKTKMFLMNGRQFYEYFYDENGDPHKKWKQDE